MFSKSSKYWVLACYPATFKSCSALGLTLQLVAYGGKAWPGIILDYILAAFLINSGMNAFLSVSSEDDRKSASLK